MTTETKWLGIILISTLILLFGGIFLLTRGSPSKTVAGVTISQIDYSKGEKIGSDSAKVKVVEFSDLECPACLAAEPYVKKLITTYPDQNQIQVIYRHFPLPQHTHSRQVAALAEAAGKQGKFWEMHDKLFDTQSQWSGMTDATPFFMDLVKQLDLDADKIKQAMEENAIKAIIDNDASEGRSLGVNQTPTFFINGRKLNLKSFDDLVVAVVEELKK